MSPPRRAFCLALKIVLLSILGFAGEKEREKKRRLGDDPDGMGGWLPRTARETGTLATTLY